MFLRLPACLPVALGVLLIVPVEAQAKAYRVPRPPNNRQQKQKQNQNQPTVETVTIDGTVEAIGPQGFKASAGKEQAGNNNKKKGSTTPAKQWLIAPNKTTTWLVTGTAKASYLKSGQMIVFKAELDDKKQPKDKVSELTIVSAKGHTSGITADDGDGPLKPKDPGVEGDAPVKKPARKAEKKDADPDLLAGKVKVTGRISKVSGNKLTVRAGDKTVDLELDDSPTINIEMNDPKLLAVGAKVTVHGQAMEYKQNTAANYCQADDIKVTLLLPLTGKEKPAALKPESLPEKADADPSAAEQPAPDAGAAGDQKDDAKGAPPEAK